MRVEMGDAVCAVGDEPAASLLDADDVDCAVWYSSDAACGTAEPDGYFTDALVLTGTVAGGWDIDVVVTSCDLAVVTC